MKKLTTFLILTFLLHGAVNSQEKYAVLITGQYAANPEGFDNSGHYGEEKSPMNEFWNDTFLMWELLQTKGFSQENIFVLFADGVDHPENDELYANRYRPADPSITVTDYDATIESVELVFNGLTHGSSGFPKVTQDDFLFVFTFGHGNTTSPSEPVIAVLRLFSYTEAYTPISAIEFAELVGPIEANKKVFWMQQCSAGLFGEHLAELLSEQNAVFLLCNEGGKYCRRADDILYIGGSMVTGSENEIIDGITYHHGEFNFHGYSVLNGETPAYSATYNDEPYTVADINNDGIISFNEAFVWMYEKNSIVRDTFQIVDVDILAPYTSLEYPTLLHGDITHDIVARGHIGISKDVHIKSESSLTFKGNLIVDWINYEAFIVENNGKLIIDEGIELVIPTGTTLSIENCAYLEIISDAQLIIEEGGILKISPGALINAHQAHAVLDIRKQLYLMAIYIPMILCRQHIICLVATMNGKIQIIECFII